MIHVYWNQCQGNVWCKLNTVNLSHEHFNNMDGVYIIWHGGDNASTVRVGQGNIRNRLQHHRGDQDVQKFNHLTLYVTWASVPQHQRNGVEKYLSQSLDPIIGSRFPDVPSIDVNLPW